MPISYSAADAFVDFQSDHTGAAATCKPTAQIPIANATLRARPMLKHTLLMVLVYAKCPAFSLLGGNEYDLRGTREVSVFSCVLQFSSMKTVVCLAENDDSFGMNTQV
jgi:hypothetical protein